MECRGSGMDGEEGGLLLGCSVVAFSCAIISYPGDKPAY